MYSLLQVKEDPSQQAENTVIMGWCVPAACRSEELQDYLNKYLDEINFHLKIENITYTAAIPENFCQKEGEYNEMDHTDISFG